MKRLIYISNWLYLVSLSIWLSGMFLLGILVEIFVRTRIKDQGVQSHVMNGIMDAFNTTIIYYCIMIMITACLINFLIGKYGKAGYVPPSVTKRRYSKEVILVIMVVLAIYIGSFLRPQMHELDALKKAKPESVKLERQFKSFHSQLVWIYTVNMVLGLSLFYIGGKEMARFEGGPPAQDASGKA